MLRLIRHPACLLLMAAVWLAFASPILWGADFDRDIQPLLTGKCLQCHGQSEPEAGLRLTSREGAIAGLESGKKAVVPGKSAESELILRVVLPGRSTGPIDHSCGNLPLSPWEIWGVKDLRLR
ncbi:MAG: hypothetical protein K8R36_15460 [Planctomycetales bacterium]|nr:hypothetical protein [Planctomycetales bacterium]